MCWLRTERAWSCRGSEDCVKPWVKWSTLTRGAPYRWRSASEKANPLMKRSSMGRASTLKLPSAVRVGFV